jgi:hypothetical protein
MVLAVLSLPKYISCYVWSREGKLRVVRSSFVMFVAQKTAGDKAILFLIRFKVHEASQGREGDSIYSHPHT